MALIDCNECGNQISDSAAACPRCGAPVMRQPAEHQEFCPFCKTIVDRDATVCPGCEAVKGYTTANGRIYGRGRTIFWGVIMPILFALFFFALAGAGSDAAAFFGLLLGSVMLIPIVLSIRRLITGPVWFRRTI